MITYAVNRILMSIPTLFIVSVIVFALMRMVPGDPAAVMVGDLQDPTVLEDLRNEMGLDEPIFVQFTIWISDVVQGELGTSIMTGEPVLEALVSRFAVTAQIVLVSVAIAIMVAVPAGLLAAARQNSRSDLAVVGFVILGVSLPSFWVGILLILIFGVELQWLPTIGYVSVAENLWLGVQYLILPIFALLLGEMATLTRMMRSSTIEVLRLEYIMHARAKGLSEQKVLWRHAMPNSFGPVLTIIGLMLGHMLGGAVVIETVFTLPGLGRFLAEGIYARDYPVVQGALLLVAFIYVSVNLLVDLLYPVFDPKVRL
ncbi:ABC transporter permease [Kordiimonas sp.]|uniref:ABC transporter permease n=1 Tax=Kordiimonas sp. TaxID=1970157 RepID=UPI003A928815